MSENGDATAKYQSFPLLLQQSPFTGTVSGKDLTDANREAAEATALHTEALAGDTAAMLELGRRYRKGQGVPRDAETALQWFLRAAEQGDTKAQLYASVMYADGDGVRQNYTEAVKWYRKAADQGNVNAQVGLANIYSAGNIHENYTEAMKWYRKAADENGSAEAMYRLGRMYEFGQGVTQDKTESTKWYGLALKTWLPLAEHGNAEAQKAIAHMYRYGEGGVTQDYEEAIKWYQRAAYGGDTEAQFYTGMMYEFGQGVTQDDAEAMKWFCKAADQGNTECQLYIGVIYWREEDYAAAAKWLGLAAERGDAEAQYYCGRMFKDGKGLNRDYVLAYMWYRLAEGGGFRKAAFELKYCAQQMTEGQLIEAERLAAAWKPSPSPAAAPTGKLFS